MLCTAAVKARVEKSGKSVKKKCFIVSQVKTSNRVHIAVAVCKILFATLSSPSFLQIMLGLEDTAAFSTLHEVLKNLKTPVK